MSSESHIEYQGTITQCGMGGVFKVQIEETGNVINAKLGGKMRRFKIKIVLGDEVTVAVSPYDGSRGLIIFRKK